MAMALRNEPENLKLVVIRFEFEFKFSSDSAAARPRLPLDGSCGGGWGGAYDGVGHESDAARPTTSLKVMICDEFRHEFICMRFSAVLLQSAGVILAILRCVQSFCIILARHSLNLCAALLAATIHSSVP